MPDLSQLTARLWIAEAHGWCAYDARVVALDPCRVDLELHFELAARLARSEEAHVVAFGDDGLSALVDVDRTRATAPGVTSFRFAEPALIADAWIGEWMAVAAS